jgi:hypothetical protein
MELFISHSSEDSKLVERVIDLVRAALNIAADEIRCTSVDGYKLGGGANTDEALRREIHSSRAFIGILSPASLNSMYVAFELGARWGANKHLIPLLAPEVNPNALSGPLTGINALSCDNPADLHQLVSDLGGVLEIDPGPPAAYQKHIDSILELASSRTEKRSRQSVDQPKQEQSGSGRKSDQRSNNETIEDLCEERWPDDFQMRSHCIEQQREAREELRSYQPEGVSEEVVDDIKSNGKKKWPRDFQMRFNFVRQQVESYRKLNE